jgi:hypothetical protein
MRKNAKISQNYSLVSILRISAVFTAAHKKPDVTPTPGKKRGFTQKTFFSFHARATIRFTQRRKERGESVFTHIFSQVRSLW